MQVVPCEAGCHTVGVDIDDELVYFNLYVGKFYSGQESFLSRIRKRLLVISLMILGREYLLEDVVISKDNALKLLEYIDA